MPLIPFIYERSILRVIKKRAEALRIYVVLTNFQSGLEPETFSLVGSCSIQLSYWSILDGAKLRKYILRTKGISLFLHRDSPIHRSYTDSPAFRLIRGGLTENENRTNSIAAVPVSFGPIGIIPK